MQILSIKIACHNLELAEEFYSSKLGLPLMKKTGSYLMIRVGKSTIQFIKSDHPSVYHFAFNIPHNQLKESLAWISDKVTLISYQGNVIVDFCNWNAHSIYFYDPLGNILEFIARHDIPNTASNPFNANSIECVSEIAVTTRDVYEFTELMKSRYGFGLYKKQPRLENFAAMGDENGLLIVSKTGRNWFPTEKIAKAAYTSVTLLNNHRKITRVFNKKHLKC